MSRRRVTLSSSIKALVSGLLLAACVGILAQPTPQKSESIKLLSTTSTENSGLLRFLLPQFERATGIIVHVVAVGTGQALRAARDGEGDLLVVHDEASELVFIEAGYGVSRYSFMYNDFVVAGPQSDPAGIAGLNSITAVFRQLHASAALFISRADDSGTHKREMQLWSAAGVDPRGASGEHYHEAGAGMGKTLNMAAAVDGYLLVDRGTWLSFNNKQNLRIMVEGDPLLFNQYSAITINAERHPHINSAGAEQLVQWLVSPAGQSAISEFQITGQMLFHPNYNAGVQP